jgi:hypothetical protein
MWVHNYIVHKPWKIGGKISTHKKVMPKNRSFGNFLTVVYICCARRKIFCTRRKSHLKEDIHVLQKIYHLLQKNKFICNRRYSSVTTSSAAKDSFFGCIYLQQHRKCFRCLKVLHKTTQRYFDDILYRIYMCFLSVYSQIPA